MRGTLTSTVNLLLLVCVPVPRALADEPTCLLPIGRFETGQVNSFHDGPDGLPLVGAWEGLFRYDGKGVVRVEGEEMRAVSAFHDGPDGLLLGAGNGLFRYDGKVVVRVKGENAENVRAFHDGPDGLLLGAESGLFRYDSKGVVRVGGEEMRGFSAFHDGPDGLLLGAENGLFRYDGKGVVRVGGEEMRGFSAFHDGPDGLPLVGVYEGLFRYDGKGVVRVEGKRVEKVGAFHDGPGGLLLGARNGLFRYDGKSVVRVEGEETSSVYALHDRPGGLLLGAQEGLFRYDGKSVVRVKSVVPVEWREETGYVIAFHDVPGGLLLGTLNGVFRYDGKGVVRVNGGEKTGTVTVFHDVPGEQVLVGAENGLFRVIFEPLSSSQIELSNGSKLREASPPPSQFGIQTIWTMKHPCAAFADRFGLHVVATNASRKDDPPVEVKHFDPVADGTTSFEVAVPISDPGDWTFRVVSKATGATVDIGKPSKPVTFVTSGGTPGFIGWLAAWWKVIGVVSAVLWVAFNLLVFARSRYSAAAWRLATDPAWGKTTLAPLMLLLRHSQSAQLWLLDLYVRERRGALPAKPRPFLSLPLTGPEGVVAESDAVLGRLGSTRRLWVQGGTGMGKTAIFLHLVQTHFGGIDATSFTIFQRDGYVLVSIEARRFPEAPLDEKGASAWVVACVLSVLSERGLSFEDRGLLRAMLNKGTLAIAIDGLSEVARGPSVAAFAAEYPATAIFVTSQEFR